MIAVVAIRSAKGRTWVAAPLVARSRTSVAARDLAALARHLAFAA